MQSGRFSCALLLFVNSFHALSLAPIHESKSVRIGGINQWIDVRGEDDQNPVLLYLHGGPGSSVISYADRFTKELQKHFVLVFWDQRASGKTKTLNPPEKNMTATQFERDAIEVIAYLTKRFNKKKVFLAGHSWGGFLGLKVAANHPELLSAYFAIAPMVYQNESERQSLSFMKEIAQNKNNKNAIAELTTIKIPFENGTQLYYHRKWLTYLIDMHKPDFSKAYVENWATTWLSLFNEASAENFAETAPEINCPIYFLEGRKDYQTYFKLTEGYYQKLKAEKKELFWFDNSSHSLNLSEPGKFQEVIISILKKKL